MHWSKTKASLYKTSQLCPTNLFAVFGSCGDDNKGPLRIKSSSELHKIKKVYAERKRKLLKVA